MSNQESFSDLLREKMAELDADEAPPRFVEDHPVDALGLGARQCLQVASMGLRPSRGRLRYSEDTVGAPPEPSVRHLNIMR